MTQVAVVRAQVEVYGNPSATAARCVQQRPVD